MKKGIGVCLSVSIMDPHVDVGKDDDGDDDDVRNGKTEYQADRNKQEG